MRLHQRSAQRQKRLARKQRGAFRDSEQITRETQLREHVEETAAGVGKLRKSPQVRDFFRGEAQIQEIIDGLLKSRGQNEIPAAGQTPDEQLKRCAVSRLTGLEVARRHRELVEVGEEGLSAMGYGRRPGATSCFLYRAPLTDRRGPLSRHWRLA